jgi:hypothetical protein
MVLRARLRDRGKLVRIRGESTPNETSPHPARSGAFGTPLGRTIPDPKPSDAKKSCFSWRGARERQAAGVVRGAGGGGSSPLCVVVG